MVNSSSSKEKYSFQAHFLHPKYWGIWLVFALVLPLIYLPLRWQFIMGKGLGLLCFHLIKRRQNDTLINLSLCFPQHTVEERYAMARDVFINAGIGIFETLSAWFRPHIFPEKISVTGLEAFKQARQDGKAIFMLGGHFTLMDLGALFFARYASINAVYRPQNNPLLDWFICSSRSRIFDKQVSSRNIRDLASVLNSGGIVWYSPDQDFGLKYGVMAPFFGVDAATITAGRRLSQIGDTVVMAIGFHRLPQPKSSKEPHYQVTITPPLDNYPSQDELADAVRVNQIFEDLISVDPAQYMWFHRRFKTQPDGINYYKKK